MNHREGRASVRRGSLDTAEPKTRPRRSGSRLQLAARNKRDVWNEPSANTQTSIGELPIVGEWEV